jgi:hypothetical protein
MNMIDIEPAPLFPCQGKAISKWWAEHALELWALGVDRYLL